MTEITIDELQQQVSDRIAETSTPPTSPQQIQAVAEANNLDLAKAGGRRQVEQTVSSRGNRPKP